MPIKKNFVYPSFRLTEVPIKNQNSNEVAQDKWLWWRYYNKLDFKSYNYNNNNSTFLLIHYLKKRIQKDKQTIIKITQNNTYKPCKIKTKNNMA